MPDVLMPRLSDTMTEGVLVQWLKQEGDQVERGDAIAEVETDKATMEVEAYVSGVLTRIIAAPGSTVPIGQAIAVIGDPSPAPTAGSEAPAPVSPSVVATPAPSRENVESASLPPMSPLARSLARAHGVDLARIAGTGPGGRIVRADVEAAVAAAGSTDAPAVAGRESAPTAEDERVPLTAIRRITAQRLTESAAAPTFYLTSVVDAGALAGLRRDLNTALAGTAPKLSLTDLLIRACAVTVRAHPKINASWGGDHLVRHGRVNIGIAVALDDGLIVPVIRDADRKGITEIATEAHGLTERARAGKLAPDEFSGSTFTISNLGTYGIDHFTAVINPPEAAILAVGAAREEAVVRDGQLVAATTMKITLSVDHRVLDGATAAAFLRDLVDLLEHPLRALV